MAKVIEYIQADSNASSQTAPLTDRQSLMVGDKSKLIYYVYLAYGFGMLTLYNAVLSTLDYFNDEMPNYNPSFFFSFGYSLLIAVFLFVVTIVGHLIPYGVKNNLMLLLQIPFTLALPFCVSYFDSEGAKFYSYIGALVVTGVFGAF